MPRFIYFIPISLILHACGGGNTDDMSEEELSQYPPTTIIEQHNEMTSKKGIMPVNCVENPQLCT